MLKLAIVLLLSCTQSFSSDLKCYDCDPSSEGRCVTPHKDNVKITVCSDSPEAKSGVKKQIVDIDQLDINPRLKSADEKEYECFSLYYDEAIPDKAGVYRGCVEKPKDVRSSCDYLKERLDEGNVTICATCAGNSCNIDDVGGVASFTASVAVVVVNLVLCLYVFNL